MVFWFTMVEFFLSPSCLSSFFVRMGCVAPLFASSGGFDTGLFSAVGFSGNLARRMMRFGVSLVFWWGEGSGFLFRSVSVWFRFCLSHHRLSCGGGHGILVL
ncbi:hypothetical protein L195_g026897 [Trifolium pratense]|uniref:Secreted protein n=1 Tax=Trifolium pratense TaxID=57577 RepID=A0A2K3NKK8_TRIPR|nr:hypothetical protein L195_g026897 [Trifolium pratense]